MDPGEQYAALRKMGGDEHLLAIYHSHPATQAYPSPTDREQARLWPEQLYVLVSLRTAAPELRAFRIRDGWVGEVDVRTEPAAP